MGIGNTVSLQIKETQQIWTQGVQIVCKLKKNMDIYSLQNKTNNYRYRTNTNYTKENSKYRYYVYNESTK